MDSTKVESPPQQTNRMNLSRLISAIRLIFPKLPASPELRENEIVSGLVSRYARGSVSLFQKRYTTPKDVRTLRAEILSHK
jgi:hypothetical protein